MSDLEQGCLCGSVKLEWEGRDLGDFRGPCSASVGVWITQVCSLSRLIDGVLAGCHRDGAQRSMCRCELRKEGRPPIRDHTSHLPKLEASQEEGGHDETLAEGVRPALVG